MRGVTHRVEHRDLFEAETLNGLQWNGSVDFGCSVNREYLLDGPQGNHWSDWSEGGPPGLLSTYALTKKNGQWTTDYVEGGGKEQLTKPSEEQIKNILPQ